MRFMAEGRKPGKKELKDEAELDLPPMAFTKQGSMWVWIDAQARTLMLDTGAQDHADEVGCWSRACPASPWDSWTRRPAHWGAVA
ncbi:hypothetical protein P353_18125 [Comamonas testosteroni]|uniref:Uncharacterized protein n=1 Tax=Comamonas testosteroni TaxID=285 RepID=A0A096FB29_COMTE|nr:hypothetical protein P353_18125 [Comamonas testosteroni]